MYGSSHPRSPAHRPGTIGCAILLGLATALVGVAMLDDSTWRVGAPLALAMLGLVAGDDAPSAIDQVTDAIDRLADGEYDVEVPTGRTDEIGRLSESVRGLADELREREREADRREQFTDDLLAAVDDVFYVLDREGNLRRWNESLVDVTGYDDDEIAEMHALDFFPESQRESIADAIDEAVETGHARVEAPLLTAGGESLPHEFVATSVEEPPGEPVVIGIGRNVTERMEYQRELERTTELLELAQRLTGVSGWVLDVSGENRTLTATEELYHQVGIDPGEELDVDSLIEAYHPEDRPRIQAEISASLERGEPYEILARFQRPDGSTRWMRTIGEPVEDGGEVVAIRGSMQDVTERLEREQRLQESERRLSTLMDHVPGMVYRARNEPDWPLEFVSEGCRELTGYEPDALIDGDVNWNDDVIADRHDALWEAVQEALTDHDSFQVLYPIESADGERRWISEQGRGVHSDDGSVEALEGVMIDVTEQVTTQHDLERATHQLEQSQRLANLGPWEIDLSDEVPRPWLSDEVARLHGLDPDADVDLEAALDFYHPDDRPLIRKAVERAIDDGEGYDLELRLQPADDTDRRWVRTIGESVVENGEVVAVRGAFQDITDRKERERELERYETIVQAIGDPVYALDADGDFRFVNDAIERLAGWDPDELVGESVATVMTEAGFETGQEAIRELHRSDEPFQTFEMELLAADGGAIETENSMALLPDPDGEYVGIAGVARDITERNERERTLERTRDLLQRVQRMAAIGGWELDPRPEPSEITWTEELYRLHDLPTDVSLDLETILDCHHPDDRRRVRTIVERALATETGYDVESRLVSDGGDTRWVRLFGEPVRESDELVAYRGAVQDVTQRKERELALESLHETAVELLNAESPAAVAERVVETAGEILDVGGVSLYALDDDTNELDPIAYTAGFVDCSGPASSVPVETDSLLWTAFATGTRTAIDDPATLARAGAFGDAVDRALLVPIGDHGVFAAVSSGRAIDEASRRLVETLAATAEAAFDRLESEASLRERDAELAERNRRLERQIRITEIIRSIDQSLVGADSRAEIERTVCEKLVEADGITFAWIGAADVAGETLDARAWAGEGGSYLDAVSLDPEDGEPAAIAADRGQTTVVSNVVDGLTDESWRTEALGHGFQSVVTVPLVYEEYSYGVLSVYADEPDAFADLERTVFTELGDGIASAITGVRTREALHTESHTELTLRADDDDELLGQLARRAGCRVEYEGLGTLSDGETIVFVSADADPATVTPALDELVSVSEYRLLGEGDAQCRLELSVAGDVLAGRLVRHGGAIQSMVADGNGIELVVDVPTPTDVRAFVSMLEERYDGVELVGRRDVTRESQTPDALAATLLEELTPRQREVLRTAYYAGFFEWPRASTGQEIAETLDVSQPTVNRHVRLGQGRLLEQLFERAVDVGGASE